MKSSLVSTLPLSFITKIFFLLIAALTSQAAEDEYYTECSKKHDECGPNTEIKYPFYVRGHPLYCGLEGYEVSCEESMPYQIFFNMGLQYFKILHIERSNFTMTLARADLLETYCPKSESSYVDTIFSSTLFDLEAEDFTLFYSCDDKALAEAKPKEKFSCDGHYGIIKKKISPNVDGSEAKLACDKNITLPLMKDNWDGFERGTLQLQELVNKGFDVRYESQGKMAACHICERSGGLCGTNTTSQFTCFCKDGPHDYFCPGKKPHVGTYIGIGFAGLAGLFLIAAVVFIVLRCRNKKGVPVTEIESNNRRKEKFFKRNSGLLQQKHFLTSDDNVENTKKFKSNELEKATNLYSVDRVLGQGAQGTVYKGILSDGRLVAVKASKSVEKANLEQFFNEVVILSQINHRNIVKLLGCCLETEVPMLVYEYISNGTLFQLIHNPNEEFPLTWKVRLRIATEIAGSLSYLHNAAPMPIYHRDIKSTNILLDDKYKAKVSDFGISRSVDVEKTHLTTQLKGTFGYLDPEYFWSSQFNEKSDVYSFGVVLAELLTGKKPIFSNTSQEFRGLAPYFLESMEENHLFEMIDPQMSTEDKMEEIVEVAHLAKSCLNSNGKRRPTMKEVAAQLERIRMSREKTTPQENEGTEYCGEGFDDISTSSDGSMG